MGSENLKGIVRPGLSPILMDCDQRCIAAVEKPRGMAEFDDIAFYNYGHLSTCQPRTGSATALVRALENRMMTDFDGQDGPDYGCCRRYRSGDVAKNFADKGSVTVAASGHQVKDVARRLPNPFRGRGVQDRPCPSVADIGDVPNRSRTAVRRRSVMRLGTGQDILVNNAGFFECQQSGNDRCGESLGVMM